MAKKNLKLNGANKGTTFATFNIPAQGQIMNSQNQPDFNLYKAKKVPNEHEARPIKIPK